MFLEALIALELSPSHFTLIVANFVFKRPGKNVDEWHFAPTAKRFLHIQAMFILGFPLLYCPHQTVTPIVRRSVGTDISPMHHSQ